MQQQNWDGEASCRRITSVNNIVALPACSVEISPRGHGFQTCVPGQTLPVTFRCVPTCVCAMEGPWGVGGNGNNLRPFVVKPVCI